METPLVFLMLQAVWKNLETSSFHPHAAAGPIQAMPSKEVATKPPKPVKSHPWGPAGPGADFPNASLAFTVGTAGGGTGDFWGLIVMP